MTTPKKPRRKADRPAPNSRTPAASLLDTDPDVDLPTLNEKQHAFVFALLEGNSGADAYRIAYGDETSLKRVTIHTNATRLRNDPKIKAWIAAAHKAHLGTAALTADAHMRELASLRQASRENGDFKAAVNAEIARGRVAGHYVERHEVTHLDPAALIDQMRRISPRIAELLAEKFSLRPPVVIDHDQTSAR